MQAEVDREWDEPEARGMSMNSGFDEEAMKLEFTRRLENLPVKDVAMKPPSG